MSLEDQLGQQDLEDGLTLQRLRDDEPLWAALGRVARRIHDDAVQQFSQDAEKSRKWLAGALETCDALLPAIEDRVRAATAVVEERKAEERVILSPSLDGQGSGDLV